MGGGLVLDDVLVTRRSLMAGGLAAGGLALTRDAHACDSPTCCTDGRTWSQAGFEDGADVVISRGGVVLDRDARVGTLTVGPGAWLAFDPSRRLTLTATGNVVVQGVLRMAPRSLQFAHALVFAAVDEAGFVGGGTDPVPTDVGLWVTGSGRLELQGTARTPWSRLAESALHGGRRLVLAAAPIGWRPGDELVITPSGAPTGGNAHQQYDTVRVAAVSGRVVMTDRPLQHGHPLVRVAPEVVLGAEVLNLTRNVRVEGTPAGRSHVWIASTARSVLEHAQIRHVGPRQATPDGHSRSVLGRYGLHLHMNRDASRGTRVVGMVVRDCGAHAFVPHLSHGVTFEGCVSHDTADEAYWYDLQDRGSSEVVRDLVYDGCVASLVRAEPSFRGYRLAGFLLGAGRGLTITRCVAVGVQGNVDAAGFSWPEDDDGIWRFTSNVSHNNKVHGSFVWQNAKNVHVVDRLVAYHNGGSGVSHGAYVNAYQYVDNVLYGNRDGAVLLHALGRERTPMQFLSCVMDGAGRSGYAVVTTRHNLAGVTPVLFQDCALRGYVRSGFGFAYEGGNGSSRPEYLDVLDCSFSGNELLFAEGAAPGARVRFQRTGEVSLMVGGPSDAGTPFPRWNGRFRPVAPLARGRRRARVSPVLPPFGPLGKRTALPVCPRPAGGPPTAQGH